MTYYNIDIIQMSAVHYDILKYDRHKSFCDEPGNILEKL